MNAEPVSASAAEETTLHMMPVRTWRAPLSGAVRPWSLSGWELSQKKPAPHEDLSLFSIGKLSVTVALINSNCLFVVAGYLKAIHMDGFGTERMKLDMTKNTFLHLRELLEPWRFPAFGIKEVVFACVNSNSDWVQIVDTLVATSSGNN